MMFVIKDLKMYYTQGKNFSLYNYFIDLFTLFMELCSLDISKVVCEVSAWAWRSLQSLHSIPQYSCMLNSIE